MVAIELLPEFGYVVFTAIGSIFMLMYFGIKVGQARKLYGVEYPTMYDEKQKIFNCYQRAHLNTLENYPQFLILLFLGGLKHPLLCSAAGVIWIIGRILYAHGYYSGDPKKRLRGAIAYVGYFILIGCTISLGLQLIRTPGF